MTVAAQFLAVWLAITTVLFTLPTILGILRIRSAPNGNSGRKRSTPPTPIELLIPIRGVNPNQEEILTSLLNQTHPSYKVVFILESESDPANPLVNRLCIEYPQSRKVISGLSTCCAQKNHSLIAGVNGLRPETEIIVFCDSSNMAPPDWLMRFTDPIDTRGAEVVSTFRSFKPMPATLGGVCQAIYASFILLLGSITPKPWGGATAIRRDVFERLNVTKAWGCTVVDDLILGNLLDGAGIKVTMDPHNLLQTPLVNQTVRGFLNYLDRQILFPKFTNPGIWLLTLVVHLDVTLSVLVAALIGLILFPAGLVSPLSGGICLVFLSSTFVIAYLLRRLHRCSVPVKAWFVSFFVSIFLAAFIFLRSLFRNYIIWHGRQYWTGPLGVVLRWSFKGD